MGNFNPTCVVGCAEELPAYWRSRSAAIGGTGESLHADELEEALALPRWRDIETAPKDGTWVQLYGGAIEYRWDGDSEPPVVVGQYTTEMNQGCWQFAWYDGGYYGEYRDPTHWMPIPELPL